MYPSMACRYKLLALISFHSIQPFQFPKVQWTFVRPYDSMHKMIYIVMEYIQGGHTDTGCNTVCWDPGQYCLCFSEEFMSLPVDPQVQELQWLTPGPVVSFCPKLSVSVLCLNFGWFPAGLFKPWSSIPSSTRLRPGYMSIRPSPYTPLFDELCPLTLIHGDPSTWNIPIVRAHPRPGVYVTSRYLRSSNVSTRGHSRGTGPCWMPE